MLIKNVMLQVLSYFKRLRLSFMCDRDVSCVIVPVPIILLSREGFCFGFLFAFWQIGFSITKKENY